MSGKNSKYNSLGVIHQQVLEEGISEAQNISILSDSVIYVILPFFNLIH